jgi:hypothetical protein
MLQGIARLDVAFAGFDRRVAAIESRLNALLPDPYGKTDHERAVEAAR